MFEDCEQLVDQGRMLVVSDVLLNCFRNFNWKKFVYCGLDELMTHER
jgi:hypothetical protein